MIKVYGWIGYRSENPHPHNKQTREICAANSKAEVYRIVGSNNLPNICETGNKSEIQIAMSKPGVVFWSPLDYREYREVE
jgi:hypothetical protein